MKFVLDEYSVLLLDMNGTFMFGEDRFGVAEDFHATYRAVGGQRLNPSEVNQAIRDCYEGMLNLCKNPQHFDNFPCLAEGLQLYTSVPKSEFHLLEKVFTAHELGRIPPAYAELLQRLSRSHQLGLVSNIWGSKQSWLAEFTRAGIKGLFAVEVFSSDSHSIKPSLVLFQKALQAFSASARILFVGDSLDRDMKPAKQLGLSTAWIGTTRTIPPNVDYIFSNLLEIENII
jgi:HAD superfamily hydrolase (TIGR01549 family)